tara:strand:+ start:253 stop:438 length:186 start_codon:yes stop_codon:yes gene_type:complete
VKVGDLVRVSETHWHNPGQMGIIVRDLFDRGKAFKVLFADGIIRSKLKNNLEVINEDRRFG